MIHIHNMHLLNVRNPRLTVKQEERLPELVWTLGNAREIRRNDLAKFNSFFTIRDENYLRTRFPHLGVGNYVVRVKQVVGV